MKFLYVHAMGKNRESNDIIQALRQAGHEAVIYPKQTKRYDMLDDFVIAELEAFICDNEIDISISIHFIINLAFTAYKNHMKYIALLWDAPFITVYSFWKIG